MEEVIKKFKFRDKAVVLNAPAAMSEAFMEHGFIRSLDKKNQNGNTLVFINNKQQFMDFLQNDLQHTLHDGVLWFAYPKGTSKIKTDINRDILRVTGEEYGMTTVAAISIDDTWSGLRFRPVEKTSRKRAPSV